MALRNDSPIGVGRWDKNGNRRVVAYIALSEVRKALGQEVVASLNRWQREAREGHANPLAYKNERYNYFLVPTGWIQRNGMPDNVALFRGDGAVDILPDSPESDWRVEY